jgi:NTE family protein
MLCGLLLAAALLAGCQASQIVVNRPLATDAAGQPVYYGGYRFADLVRNSDSDMLLVLAFSGGGKRSAAFAHGALRGLRAIPVSGQRSLLDQTSFISSVSGGSFPAAHYGLYGDRSFQTFEADFLRRDIEAYIYGTFLLPWNWEWLVDPLYGTNDRMAAVYDRLMFHGATYKALLARGAPMIGVNATDIANGVPFAFTQPNFDLLCSDLSAFPVARAVAASNGFPLIFTPITLNSYRKECGRSRPPGVLPAQMAGAADELSRRAMLARTSDRYMDPATTRYVHLMDGGIADNLTLRSLLNALIGLDSRSPDVRALLLRTRRVLFLSVDGEAAADATLGQKRVVSGLGQVFSAVSGTQIDAYNFETLLLAEDQVKGLVAQTKRVRCEDARAGGDAGRHEV